MLTGNNLAEPIIAVAREYREFAINRPYPSLLIYVDRNLMDNPLQFIDSDTGNDIFPKEFSNQIYFSSDAQIYFEYKTVYSVKYTRSGIDQYEFGNTIFQVTSQKYLIVNNDREVVCHPSASEKALSIFLDPSLVKDVFMTLSLSHDRLLSNPFGESSLEPHFFEHVYPIDDNLISSCLLWLAHGFDTIDRKHPGLEMGMFYRLAEGLILSQQQTFHGLARTRAAKTSTKEELYKRMLTARSMLHDSWNKRLCLKEVARNVYMSPYHFHRIFKSTFGLPPARYQAKLRLEKARLSLLSGRQNVSEVALEVGYEDIFSFSKAFKKMFGLAPSKLAGENSTNPIPTN